jgi:2-polyprenyl-3-methyl-5-hydroxy-6-metoxy-1,4-benzoquinol methylase
MKAEFPMELQAHFWNDWVERSKTWEVNPDNARRALHVLRAATRAARPGARLLEVGCGSGWMSLELARHFEVTATDLAAEALEPLKQTHPQVRWIGGDFQQVSLPHPAYDVVVCMETLSHVPDQEAFVRRIAELTIPGGLVVVTTQNGNMWKRDRRLLPPRPGQLRNWQTPQRLQELFGPYYHLEPIHTCAPGGDRGLLRLLHNRITRRAANRLLGEERWVELRERAGLGLSQVVVGARKPV